MYHKFKLKQRVAALCMAAMICCSLFPAGVFAEAPRADADGTLIMEQDKEAVTDDSHQTEASDPDPGEESTPKSSEAAATSQSADEDAPVETSTDYTFDGAVLYTDLPDAPTGSYMGSQGLPVATGETKIGISAWLNDQLEESTDSYLSADTLNSDDLTLTAPLLEGTDYVVAPILAQVEYPAVGSSLDVVLPNEATVLNFYGAPADEATRSSLVHSEYTETSAAVMGLYVQADADFSAQLVYTAPDGSTLTKVLHVVIDRSRTMRHTLYYTQRNEGRFILVETKAPAGYFGDWTDVDHPGTAGTPLGKRAYYVEITADNNNSVLWLGNGNYNADIAAGDRGGTKLVTSGGVETTVTIYDSPKDASRSYTTDASGKAANEDDYTTTAADGIMKNDRTLGEISISKVDLDAQRYVTGDAAHGNAVLDGAVYDLYAAEDITHPDGVTGVVDYSKIVDANGNPIWHTTIRDNSGQWISDYLPVLKKDNLVASAKIEDGWLTFSNLYLGKYYVVERSTGTVIPLREGALAVSGTYPTVDSRTKAATGQVAALAASNGQYTDWVYKNQFSTISKSKALDGTWTYDAYYLSYPKWDFSGETQAIAKTYEVNADEIAAYNRTLTAAGDNKNGKGDGWQPTGRANEYQLAEIFSNDSGNIRVQGLSYGTYLVVETTTPHDLFQAEPFLVSIDPEQDNNPWGAMATPKDSVIKASDSYQKFTVLDEEIEVYLKITKLDTETGKPVLLPNTAFQIYWLDDNGSYRLENGKPKLVTMTDTVNGHLTKNVDTFYTNEEGILTLPEKLPLGKYRIVETVGPDGFYNEWADSGNYYVDFDISTDRIYKATGDDNENGMDTLVIGEDYWNEETLGKLTIRKTGNALTGKIEINDLIDPWMTGEADSDFAYTLRPLAGAEYTITAAEDIYTQDSQLDANGSRTLWYAKGDVVAVVTTGDGSADTAVFAPSRTKATYDFLSVIHDGTIGEVSITLPLGSYHVEETKPPYGYVGTTDSYDVTFVWDNQLSDVVMAKNIIKNGDSEQHFDVVRASEASAELAEQQTLGFYNDREHARVGVYKINQETDKYLAGAVFNLYTRDDIYDVDGNKLFSAGDLICTSPETVADGYTYFNCDVPIRGEWYGQSDRLDASTNSGNYFIRELHAPLGYYLNDAEMDVTFTYDGEVLQVLDNTCANKPTEMWVSKRDLTNDEELSGATLIIKDTKENIVDTWVSTDTPHRVTGLHFDEEYTLTEKRPADGYAVADDIVFRLERKTDADGHELDEADVYYLKDKKKLWIIPWEEWELLDDATVIMKDDITRVQISKVDIATGKELPGAELVIKDKDGNMVAQWVSEDKPHYIEKLPAGDYTLTEITAPNGYQLAESIAFTVLPTGELQTVVMKDARIPEETPHEDTPSNTPQPTPGSTPAPSPAPASTPTATPTPMPVIPQTGDVFPFALLSAAVFGSIVGFGILAYKRRKSKMDESEH